MERIPIIEDGRRVSHLAVRLDPPAGGGEARGWILYMHGFRSRQDGEKAVFFRRRATGAGLAFCSFDFQGHGESGGSLTELTPTRNQEDIARAHDWLRRQGCPRVILIGSSMGGAAALWYAARQEEVAAVLTIAPALQMGERLEAWAGPEGLARWQATGRRRFEDEMGAADLGWGMLEDLRRYRLSDLAARLAVPTLVLQGRRDASVGWRGSVELADRCATGPVELHLFGDGDHRLVDRLDRLWELMWEFLGGHGLLGR